MSEKLIIKYLPCEELKVYGKNSRTHSKLQIEQIKASIKEFGMCTPIGLHKGTIVYGHARFEALKELGRKEIPTVDLSHLTEKQKRAYVIADNKLALNASWDEELLKSELDALDCNDFDLSLIGFSEEELNDILEGEGSCGLTDEDEVPSVPKVPTAKLGDIYRLGAHRLMCGDSTDAESVSLLMDGNKADLLHTDPPYNVDYSNNDRPKAGKTDLGRIKNDKMDSRSFYKFLLDSFSCAYGVLKEDSTAYIWHASSEQVNFTKALTDSDFDYTQQIIWKKPMLLGRGRYQWAHEPCLMGIKGSPFFTNDRTKTTVWDFGGYDKSKNIHPTQKPVFIPEEAINNSSKRGGNILDLFGGSGSTLIACEKTGRACYMMELDPHYIDVIIKRWEDFTGKKAVKLNG